MINRCSRETCICGRHFDIKIDRFPCVAKAHVTGNRRWARRQNNKAYCHSAQRTQDVPNVKLFSQSPVPYCIFCASYPSSNYCFWLSSIRVPNHILIVLFWSFPRHQNSFPSSVSFKTLLLRTTPKILHRKSFTSRWIRMIFCNKSGNSNGKW